MNKKHNKNRNFMTTRALTTAAALAVFLMFGILAMADKTLVSAQVDRPQAIEELSQKIDGKKDKIEDLKNRIGDFKGQIHDLKREAVTLNSQISYIDSRLKKAELDLELTQTQIEQVGLEIESAEKQIEHAQAEMDDKKVKLALFLRSIYKLDQKSFLEIILLEDTISDFFNELRATQNLQAKLQSEFNELQTIKQNLEIKKATLLAQKESFKKLEAELAEKALNLEDERNVQAVLLAQTRQSESQFQASITQLKNQQAAVNSEIANLEREIRQRLADQGKAALQNLGNAILRWPVTKNTVTAYFQDPDYPFRHIFEHPAIDIRASQGSPVRAAEAGYVAKAKDNGLGYNYIMILHSDNLSTVYGHVSKILVSEEEFVTQGQIIALSGGLPGTPGAGRLTTGPHLHFEVRLRGIPVNPLLYLP